MRPKLTPEIFAEIADHTLLAPDTTETQLADFLDEAVRLGVKRVCISPSQLPVDKRGLEIVTVVGFPSGAHTKEVKAFEAQDAIKNGADEIDMVVNASLVKEHNFDAVEDEIRAVREASQGVILKVILETASLSDEEVTGAALAAERAGADIVKTSTGFHAAGGASVHAVELMSQAVAPRLGIKASGGVRSAADAQKLWQAGATRFGVSATASVLADLRDESAQGQNEGAEDATRGY